MRYGWDAWKSRPSTPAAAGMWLTAMLIAALPLSADAAGANGTVAVALASPVAVAAVRPTSDETAPRLLARIDLSDQTMRVYVGEALRHTFTVSTGRGSYRTPTGTWRAQWLSPRHRSRKYNNAPMPWSVFYYGGYAIHGTTEISRLGQPASHGCVRLHPDNAKIFFEMVQATGKANTTIIVVE